MRTTSVALLGCIALLTISGIAMAHENGITGYSGKDNGATCTTCHDGLGPTPTVKIDGPDALDAGAIAEYTFTVTTTNAATGMNAAVTEGMLGSIDGGLTRTEDGEVTHVAPTAPTSGKTTYKFQLTAPQYAGTITLYAAGNAVDGNGSPNKDTDSIGDNSAKTMLSIDISGPPKPDPTPPAPPPAPTPPPPAATSDAGAKTPPPAATPPSSNTSSSTTDEGCAVSDSGPTIPGGASLVAIAGLVFLRRRRR